LINGIFLSLKDYDGLIQGSWIFQK